MEPVSNPPKCACWCHVQPQGTVEWFDGRQFMGSGINGHDWDVPLDPQPTHWDLYLGSPYNTRRIER